ncbi:MAG: chorismate synthase [Acidobacteria bacterium]|nr:chorismate synthase [Acidobacteriota bacterium]
MLRFMTAGESHGKGLIGILEGLPAGLGVDEDFIDRELGRRQLGYGRGGRMKIERDRIEILSGVRHAETLGSPLSFLIANRDWENWTSAMGAAPIAEGADRREVTRPRPGHADLAGVLKYRRGDVRDVLERASARETAARVAGGAFARLLLDRYGIRIGSHVLAVGPERVGPEFEQLPLERILRLDPASPLRAADGEAEGRMKAAIDRARGGGDTLGGTVEVVAGGVPPGLGTHIQWDLRLDGWIAQAMLSIPSAKACEIGCGLESARTPGSGVHDAIYSGADKAFFRRTNRAGGIEGGMSNGEEIRVRVFFKPIPTLGRPLASVDIRSREASEGALERSDVCAVPAAGVVAEAMLGLVLARAFLEKFGGDAVAEIDARWAEYGRHLGSV